MPEPHPLALIGEPPQVRGWMRGDPAHPPIIHPHARIEAYATVDCGQSRPTRIDARAWLMKLTHVGHDAHVGEDCELAPFSTVGGYSILEKGVRCGINATILPYVVIGEGARIGAGAVVTKNVPAGEIWAGNPARPMPARDPEAPLKCGCKPPVRSPHCVFHMGPFEGGEDSWLS